VLACAPLAPVPYTRAPIADARAQTLPDLGDAAQASLSPTQEHQLGEAVVHQIRASGAYLNDPEVNDYLNEIGHRLIAASTDVKTDFRFFAVNDPTINAFALPGGFVGVNTGLILLTQSESELASVLAHEITHVTQHHIARAIAAQKDSMLMSLAGLAVAVLAAHGGGASSGDAASAAIAATQALSLQHQIDFTRSQESEADRIGFQRLEDAGFDANGMATFMERLQRATRFSGGAGIPAYLQDHPVTYERIAEAQARAASVPYHQVVDSLDYDLVRALLRSYQGEPPQAVRYFDDQLAEHKYNNRIAAQYGLVASLLRTKDHARMKSEQDADGLRLPGCPAAGRTQRRGREIHRTGTRPLPARRTTPASRRPCLRSAEQGDALAPPPGRVLRVAGQPEGRDRPARDRIEGG
jgi:predicted Zn-dependent protease